MLRITVFILFILYLSLEVSTYKHGKRFEKFMNKYSVEYTDAGCQFGWDMTAKEYKADYTFEYAKELVQNNDSLFIRNYINYFVNND